jgi:hypothetical protein
MESSDIPSRKTTFYYMVGQVAIIGFGTLKGTLVEELVEKSSSDFTLVEDSTDFTKLHIPQYQVVGVYQVEQPVHETPEKRRLRIENEKKMYEINNMSLESSIGFSDINHPQLICVGFDPQTSTPDFVKEKLIDPLGRIKICTIESMPDFYDKDVAGFYRLLESLVKRDWNSDLQIEEISRTLKTEFRKFVEENFLEYGLKRNEWCSAYP